VHGAAIDDIRQEHRPEDDAPVEEKEELGLGEGAVLVIVIVIVKGEGYEQR